METKKLHKALFILFISLLVLGISSIVYAALSTSHNVVNYISGSATVVIAILTTAYVYVTSRQLDVMAQQLKQIKVEHELQNQPLPYIYSTNIIAEKPRLYYAPPDKEPYGAFSRYLAEFKLRNLSNSPAVSIDVSAQIEIAHDDKRNYLDSVSVNIPTLEEKKEYPTDDKKERFLFATDREGILLQALREDDVRKLPTLTFRILYRNILGGCFILGNKYRIYIKKPEQDSVLSNWLSETKSFWFKYKKDLDSLKDLRARARDKWDKKFDVLKKKLGSSIKGKDMELETWPIPGMFKVSAISEEKYKEAIEDVSYGVKLPADAKCIVVQDEEET